MEGISHVPADARRNRRRGLVAASSAGLITAAAIVGCSSAPSTSIIDVPRSSPAIGGVWESPKNPVTIVRTPTFQICAKVYPGNGAPPIQYFDITANWNGNWHTLEEIKNPDRNKVYCYKENLQQEHILPDSEGQKKIRISFDVVNTANPNQRKKAPNGIQTLIYEPFVNAKNRVNAVFTRKASTKTPPSRNPASRDTLVEAA